MNVDFPRIITLLRKEKGVNQKKAADELGVSQSLLSHYEKGKRECGLDFVVKSAKYYHVSSDYLLGISSDRSGIQITIDDIPDADNGSKSMPKGSILALLSKKLILNSVNIIFDILGKSNNKQLIKSISNYLMLSVYDVFRVVYEGNDKNEDNLFSIPSYMYENKSDASKMLQKCTAKVVVHGSSSDYEKIEDKDMFRITTEILTKEYPLYYQSMLNLIQNSENTINNKTV